MRYLLVILFVLTCACAKEKAPAANGGTDEQLIEERDSEVARESIRDYRKFVFAKPLRGINSREHFLIHARFVTADSKIVVHNHFMGFKRRDGVELTLHRKGEDLHVSVATPERIAQPLKTIEHVFGHGNEVRLRIEFHDGVVGGHRALIWIDDYITESRVRQSLDNLNAATATIDSKALGYYSSASGRGIYAGLEIWSVDLLSVKRDLPYVLN